MARPGTATRCEREATHVREPSLFYGIYRLARSSLDGPHHALFYRPPRRFRRHLHPRLFLTRFCFCLRQGAEDALASDRCASRDFGICGCTSRGSPSRGCTCSCTCSCSCSCCSRARSGSTTAGGRLERSTGSRRAASACPCATSHHRRATSTRTDNRYTCQSRGGPAAS